MQPEMPKKVGRPAAAVDDECASLGFGDDDEGYSSESAAKEAAESLGFLSRQSTLGMED